MGWVQLPPTFCTMSETVCDLANRAIQSNKPADTKHRLEAQAGINDDLSYSWEPRKKEPEQASANKALEPYSRTALTAPQLETAAPPSNMPFEKPVGTTDVFMDDYIQVGQGGPRRMRKLRHHLLEAVKNKDGADGSFHSGHTTYEHKPSSTLNLYCGECSFFPQHWRDAKYCLCICAKLNKVSPKEALKNLNEGNYYQFDDIRDQPKKYSPGSKNISAFNKIGWPLKPVGDPRLKQNFVNPEYAIKQMEKNNSKAVLIQVSAVVKKVYPNPVNCNLPEKYLTWRVIDPQGNGSRFYKFKEYPREVIWGNGFDGIIEAVQSQPITAP
jgi:hypothetical protein